MSDMRNRVAALLGAGLALALSACGGSSSSTPTGQCKEVPPAPASLTATAKSASEIDLSWSASAVTDSSCAVTYQVLRGSTLVATTIRSTTYADTGLTSNTSYSYTVQAVDAAGISEASNQATAKTQFLPDTTPPSAPTGLASSAVTSTSVTLAWTASTDDVGVTRYIVYNGATQMTEVTTAGTTLSGLTPSTSYSFTVKALDAASNSSGASNAVTITTLSAGGGGGGGGGTPVDTTAPSAPSNLASSNLTPTSVTLSWNASTDNVAVTGYQVFNGTIQVATSTITSVALGSLTPATQYTFSVKAHDAAGNTSAASATISVTTASLPDTTPPTVPTGLATSGITTSSVTLSWSASTDAVGVTGYQILVGGTSKATSTGTNYTVTGLTAGTAYSFTVKAFDAAGNYSAASSAVSATTVAISTADVTVTVDTSSNRKAISPLIYGYNAATVSGAPAGTTFLRLGGHRWTTYNWTNNWSNAGNDWGPYSNDTYLGSVSNGPAYAISPTIDDAKTNGVPALVTIPIQGYVSKAKSGIASLTSTITDWFVPNVAAKGSAFTLSPSTSSTTVYQDELANFVANRWGSSATPHFALDDAPDLWGYVDSNGKGQDTHPEVQRTQLTYADLLQKSIASASAIKNAVPKGVIYGPVVEGWNGMLNLQGAIDADGSSIDQSFIDYYLANMAAASTSKRLLDVLDIHWTPEAQSSCAGTSDDKIRVVNSNNSDCVAAARVQAPRSLFDPNYVESSWITQWTTPGTSMGTGVQLIPRFQAKINAKYPGTKFAISKYNFGGEDHPSGAIAQADALGIFGREGLYAASNWQLNTVHDWSFAAWKAYRNYDGAGHNFGDTSVSASTTDVSHVSVYASVDSANANRVVLVVIHRPTLGSSGALDTKSRTVQINLSAASTLGTAKAYQLTSGSTPTWKSVTVAAPSGNSLTVTLPAMSVTTIELTP